jgi:hypothetical protein
MTKSIEYRVRAVTRYVVTRNMSDPDNGAGSNETRGEFENANLADTVMTALASQERAWNHQKEKEEIPIAVIPYEGPPPGKVMRCKVSLWGKTPNVVPARDEKGNPPGRIIEVERKAYRAKPGEPETYLETTADESDPANYKADGENLTFGVVCAGFDEKGNANVEENRIFGYWSPNVKMEMTVRNANVLAVLEKGAEYYVDFTPAPKS